MSLISVNSNAAKCWISKGGHAHRNAMAPAVRSLRSSSPQPRQVGLVVYLTQNLSLRGRSPPITFARIVRPINALQLCHWQFSHKETSSIEVQFQDVHGHVCVLESPLGRLGTTYDVHLGIIGKRVVDFLLVLIEFFSLGVTVDTLRAKIDRKSDFAPTRSLWLKISGRKGRPHQ